MTNKAKIDGLWEQFRDAIDSAYATGQKTDFSGSAYADSSVLRDYARNVSHSDDVASLLGRESANERQHRRNRPSPKGFSIESASKLIIMNNVLSGSQRTAMPAATDFLVFRHTAVEATILGYLIRQHLPVGWEETFQSLDYPKLMQSGVS